MKHTSFRTFLALAAAAALLLCLSACGGDGGLSRLSLEGTYTRDLAGTRLSVCNWGEYISEGEDGSLDTIKAFEALTGIDVDYGYFDTNEQLYAKIAGGGAGYDIVVPSDYMIQRLIAEGYLQKINYDNIPNYKYIMEEYKKIYYDPQQEYTVPYTYGMVGLIYNKTLMQPPPSSWGALWDESYADMILQFESPRDAFGTAQIWLGLDINSHDEADWRAAGDALKRQFPLLQRNVADEIYDIMEGGNAAVAPYYAGDYLTMLENNEDLGFVYPSEGTNFFYDSICLLSGAQNVAAAELFINFMLEPEVALANAEYVRYAVPHSAVRENPDYSLRGNEFLYPAELPKTQVFEHLPQRILDLMSGLWTEIKQS
ncbi:MAG: spermidine/putrescine ABC transporter substrate-binding protein [Oscillospiraceae bacterium]|nr:spermidine/putrescine ABC transporter substrate-binding protein [Oscillospiraceae bacterium]